MTSRRNGYDAAITTSQSAILRLRSASSFVSSVTSSNPAGTAARMMS